MLTIFEACAVLSTISEFELAPYQKNVRLRDGSNPAKFQSFIIKVNDSAYFWTITAGLEATFIVQLFALIAIQNCRHVRAVKSSEDECL